MPIGMQGQPPASPWGRVGGLLLGWGSDFNARRDAGAQRADDVAYRDSQATANQSWRDEQMRLDRARMYDQTGDPQYLDTAPGMPEPGQPTIAPGAPVGGATQAVAPPTAPPSLSPQQQRSIAEKQRLAEIEQGMAAQERARQSAGVRAGVTGAPDLFSGDPDAITRGVVEGGLPITAFRAPQADGRGIPPGTIYSANARLAFEYLNSIEKIDEAEAEAIRLGYGPESGTFKAIAQQRNSLRERFPSIRSVEDATRIILNEQQQPALPEPGQEQPAINLGAPATFRDFMGGQGVSIPATGEPRPGPTVQAAAGLPEPGAGPTTALTPAEIQEAKALGASDAQLLAAGYSQAEIDQIRGR